ncbi:MAG: Ppx/GppA family phosphatase [Peptococcaceae bacterium]|nr:MAG: Ppx/GppA family phosphatase [Peptococcaceae bacterium]
MEKVAAIDIGTNTVRLLVAKIGNDRLQALETGLVATRLGEGIGTGVLLPGAIERTIEALRCFLTVAGRRRVGRVVAVATSAVRDAANREEFLRRVKREVGLTVRVLSGVEEACLSYRGVMAGLPVDMSSAVVLDVGGGSTELIWAADGGPDYRSVNAGAVRMMEGKYGRPEVAAVLEPVLAEVRRFSLQSLIGVGGTVTTLAAIAQGLTVYSPQKIHGYCLSLEWVSFILCRLTSLSPAERRQVPGLPPERADIIVAGALIVELVMKGLGREFLTASETGILHGILLEEVERKKY